MRAFVVIHLCDKMIDAFSRFMDVPVVVEVNFFLLEGSDQPFGNLSVLPRTPSASYRNLNIVFLEHREIRL